MFLHDVLVAVAVVFAKAAYSLIDNACTNMQISLFEGRETEAEMPQLKSLR